MEYDPLTGEHRLVRKLPLLNDGKKWQKVNGEWVRK